ncbi:hypothetical protein GW17_00047725 [Ensete ventricosum]|nr:hypothetical protein GW17_00047725 [Ensete ventricosum]
MLSLTIIALVTSPSVNVDIERYRSTITSTAREATGALAPSGTNVDTEQCCSESTLVPMQLPSDVVRYLCRCRWGAGALIAPPIADVVAKQRRLIYTLVLLGAGALTSLPTANVVAMWYHSTSVSTLMYYRMHRSIFTSTTNREIGALALAVLSFVTTNVITFRSWSCSGPHGVWAVMASNLVYLDGVKKKKKKKQQRQRNKGFSAALGFSRFGCHPLPFSGRLSLDLDFLLRLL